MSCCTWVSSYERWLSAWGWGWGKGKRQEPFCKEQRNKGKETPRKWKAKDIPRGLCWARVLGPRGRGLQVTEAWGRRPQTRGTPSASGLVCGEVQSWLQGGARVHTHRPQEKGPSRGRFSEPLAFMAGVLLAQPGLF